METILVIIVAAAVLGLAVGGLSLRILAVKDGEFRGTCGTNNPMLSDKLGPCTVCGKKPGEACKRELNEAAA
ncbi:MAG: membrane or secreted protein [Bacteroidota bacterium]|nr:membrane or secreted protein [Bacteroidota bacterium]